jgi:hypothetical protein
MSLMDALLIEPRAPLLPGVSGALTPIQEIWFFPRGDSARGSGSEEDPYNSATRLAPARTAGSIVQDSSDASGRVAKVTLSAHGFSDYDEVLISGVTGTSAPYYNGRFLIHTIDADTFAYRMHYPGPAGISAPTGTAICTKVLGTPQYVQDLNSPTVAIRDASTSPDDVWVF